jgi:hypothetical protein
MSRRKPGRSEQLNPDPATPDIRDPEQQRKIAEHSAADVPSQRAPAQDRKRRHGKVQRGG